MYCTNYVIKPGDTLYSISRQFRIGLNEIMNANPFINVYNLRVSDVLCIPATMPGNNFTNETTYVVEEGDTLESILDRNGINLADLMNLNAFGTIYLLPGSTLQLPVVGEE